VAQLFKSNFMIFSIDPFGLDKFPYVHWVTNPVDMVTDYLIRDFRQTGLLRGIFSYRDTDMIRFLLQGNVTELLAVNYIDLHNLFSYTSRT
jgi:ABC-type uncharacterized transport system auxiliary subunit